MTQKIRVLHVVGSMNRGGVETWLMHVLRHIDRERFQFDFLVHADEPAAYDEEIRALGGNIIPCVRPSVGIRYPKHFLRIIKDNGPYNVIHSHVHHFSGIILTLARWAGIPIRISHSHSDTSYLDARASPLRKFYLASTERALRSSATHMLAASEVAAQALYGPRWKMDPRCRILYCGIDIAPFERVDQQPDLRAEFCIPHDAWVVGHVGRFGFPKNHEFIVEIARILIQSAPRIHILLVGDGPNRSHIEELVNKNGLQRTVTFAGVRDDVPELMIGVMDAFILPSRHEGLPLVGIESQAAGLPTLFSEKITREVGIVKGLYQFLPIDDAYIWAGRLADIKRYPCSSNPDASIETVRRSRFDIEYALKQLESVYLGRGAKLEEAPAVSSSGIAKWEENAPDVPKSGNATGHRI